MRTTRHPKRKPIEGGFTLIEVLIAMAVTMVGVLAISGLMVHGVRQQALSGDLTLAGSLVRAKIEQLRVTAPTHVQRSIGGSLTANVANHFDTPPGTLYLRRWVVAAGPAGTQTITVAVVPRTAGFGGDPVQFRALVWR